MKYKTYQITNNLRDLFNIFIKKPATAGLLILLSLICSGCLQTASSRGYTFDEEKLAQITVDESDRTQVLSALGSPSTVGDYGDEVWYYIGKEQKSIAFLNPKVTSQKILAITFSDGGTVSDVHTYTEKEIKDIALINETTPTYGKNMSIIQQLLGNVGRFNSKAVDYSAE